MDLHEGLPVSGYRKQSQSNVDTVNEHKEAEERLLRQIDKLERLGNADRRWLAIARTDLEKGFMALNRAVFKPERVSLPVDDASPKA